ncbi:MAG TPA: LysE family translocator [Nocardioides sp.]|uniref:LysE family translocator n=1 Tax=Nocardioides sp. TaxID=35761 RepID=UPI002E2F4088|nr:LysE family translocator [Nocardioides sp.]HEX3932621.1 LysE family translocator [Nocardioides sp.]
MVTMHQVVAFGLVALVVIAIPGPSVVFTVGRALTYGRSVALTTVVGNSLGLLTALVLVVLGLGQLVATSDAVFEGVKVVGAVYLVYLGVQALRHRHAITVSDGSRAAPPLRPLTALRQGYFVGFTNPKGYVMFVALLPQFLDRDRGHDSLQMLLLGSMAFGIGLCSDSLWALLASQLRRWFNASPKRGRTLGTVGGVSMIGLGVAVAVGGRPGS